MRNIIQDCANRQFDRKVPLTSASSSVPSQNFYKPGGTMIMTVGNYSGRVLKQGADPLGRWSYQYLSCKENKCIVAIIAYQMCQ